MVTASAHAVLEDHSLIYLGHGYACTWVADWTPGPGQDGDVGVEGTQSMYLSHNDVSLTPLSLSPCPSSIYSL